jgi:hypothetical protein
MAERRITTAEINLAFTVFQGRLPYHMIFIKDDLGLSGRAWAEPGPLGHFYLHMGPQGFDTCTTTTAIVPAGAPTRNVFIHELTHVWQGFHGVNYVFDSLVNQCAGSFTGVNPYGYTTGQWWSTYNCEQQGSIVEDWFDPNKGNRSTASSRFRYIRDNIRRGLIAP